MGRGESTEAATMVQRKEMLGKRHQGQNNPYANIFMRPFLMQNCLEIQFL